MALVSLMRSGSLYVEIMKTQQPLRLEILRRPPSPWFYTSMGFFLGALSGLVMGYPLFIVVSTIHVYLYNDIPLDLGRSLRQGLAWHNWPVMVFYLLSAGAFGAILGNIYQRLLAHRLRLEHLHQEFELQVAAMRHHYKNLVIGIEGFANRIKRKMAESQNMAALEQDVNILHDTVQRLNETLGKELIFLKALTSDLLSPQPHDFYPVLTNSIRELLELRFQEKAIKIEINGAPWEDYRDSLTFKFEPISMEVILQNILSNAMKYGDYIQVTVIELPDSVKITVTDNGPGFEVESLKKQLQAPRNRREADSTQLGLRVSLHLLEKCRGRLFAWSQPGGGSTFTPEFPK